MTSARSGDVIEAAFLAGFLGWVLEAAWTGAPRWSLVLGGERLRISFLPVYGVGGAAISLAKPLVAALPLPLRVAAYAAILAAVEQAAWRASHVVAGRATWVYENGEGTNVRRATAWGLLGSAFARGIRGVADALPGAGRSA